MTHGIDAGACIRGTARDQKCELSLEVEKTAKKMYRRRILDRLNRMSAIVASIRSGGGNTSQGLDALGQAEQGKGADGRTASKGVTLLD